MRKTPLRRSISELVKFLVIAAVLAASAEGAYRAFLHFSVVKDSPAKAFDLYGVGESTMRGEPDEEHLSPLYLVRAFLGGRIRGREIVLHQLAAGGDSIYPQYHKLRDALAWRDRRIPGAVLIYSGHNEEALEPAPSQFFRDYEWLKEKGLDRSYLAGDLLLNLERAADFRGYRSLGTYEFYLRRTIETALDAGLTPILSPAAGNLRDWEPGVFCGGEDCFNAAFSAIGPGLELESQGRFKEAIERYSQSRLRNSPIDAYLLYRIARCEESLGRYAAARTHYWDAADADRHNNQRRADREQIALVRRLASEYGVPLVDAPALFEDASAHGAPGADLFFDGHHPNFNGYLVLGKAYGQALSRLTEEPFKAGAKDADGLCRLMHIDAGRRARILMDRGWTVVSYSFGHALPEARMRLAEANFKAALALDAGDLASWLGLGLIDAARREPRLLQEPEEIAWLSARGLPLNPSRGACPPHDLNELGARFKSLGVPDSILEHFGSSDLKASQCEARRAPGV